MKKEKPPVEKVPFILFVSADQIVDAIAESVSHKSAADLIKKLDAAMQDYEFTLALRDHFIAEIAKCDAEDAEGQQ